MIFSATEVSCNELKYEILRKEINGIKLVEINKENSTHHDFVLINYPVTKEALEEIKKLNTIYKKQQNTICFIGCADGNDVLFDIDDYLNLSFQFSDYFDLYYPFPDAKDFEILIQTCYSWCTGKTHTSLQNWFILKNKDKNTFSLNYEDASSLKEAVQLTVDKLQKVRAISSEKCVIKNAIISILSNDINLTIDELREIRNLQNMFEKDCSCRLNCNIECEKIDRGKIRLVLLAS